MLDNISLLPPPYNPKLNPQEYVWQYFSENCLSKYGFEIYDIVVVACCDA